MVDEQGKTERRDENHSNMSTDHLIAAYQANCSGLVQAITTS